MSYEIDAHLLGHGPAELLAYSTRLLPEDPETIEIGRNFMRDTYSHQDEDKGELRL
jgi:hypothetical protein